jgi:fido (protein-threonine AMPylation protein)
MTGVNDGIAGIFRPGRVRILGAKYQPPSEQQVPDLVEKMLGALIQAEASKPMLQAAWGHWAITRIHPFVDGNGRIARLWQDMILFRRGLTCAVISPELREEYLRALGTADDGDLNPLLQLLAQRVATTFDRYIVAQKKTDAISDWARNVAGELTARADEQRKLIYLRWQRKMEELRYEFQRCASAVTEAAMDIDIQLREYPMLEQPAWENIRSGARATRTWFFILSFRRHSLNWSYIFFFGKHFRAGEEHLNESVPAVNLLVAEQEGFDPSRRLDDSTDSPITFREIFLDRDQFVLVRSDPTSHEQPVFDRVQDASQIARKFLEEVVLKRLS